MLHQVQKYYVNLFENQDDKLQEINFEKLGIKSDIKVPEEDIGLPLTVEELDQVLKKMKSNKTPGIDGITSNFPQSLLAKIKIHYHKCIKLWLFKRMFINVTLPVCYNMSP